MYKRRHPCGICILEGTDGVPADGWFYILREGQVVERHRTLKKATEAYVALLAAAGVSPTPPTRPPVAPDDINSRVVGDFYIFGKFNKKKSTKSRTYG